MTDVDAKVRRLLESRHKTMLQWEEPWPACGPDGNKLDACVTIRATVHDCINMRRLAVVKNGHSPAGNDANHLLDFIAIYWAHVVEEPEMKY